jgi:hypothetical protein
MYSDSDVEAAVAAGALAPDAAAALRNYVAGARTTPAVDEEHFRLLTGFNDIFVSIAAVILLMSVAWIAHYSPARFRRRRYGGRWPFDRPYDWGKRIRRQ